MLEHGGRLLRAAHRLGIPADQWLDLSTGVSPWPWPVPPVPASAWHRLPEDEDGLLEAARAYYGTDALLPVAGSQAAIQALPLLRYRTGDIASLTREPCVCGRTFARMSAVRGRHDDMLIVRGVNLYPSQFEEVLLRVEGLAPHYQLVVERPQQLDEITVHCEPSGEADGLEDRVRHAIHAEIGVSVAVEVLEPGAVPRSEGKAVRVIDKRTP